MVAEIPEFDAFYRLYSLPVLRYAERRLSEPEAAREICAECFSIAWQKFDSAQPFPLVWLYQTARSLIGNTYRTHAREQELLTLRHAEGAPDEGETKFAVLADAMSELGSKDREALRLTFWEQLNAAEVAMVLKCSEQTAWTRISRAKVALRKSMQRIASGEGGVH
jgi:RNA polymerase sigma-70 factor (ECF subfamily)